MSYSKEDDEAPAEVLVNTNPAKNDGFDSVVSAQLLAKYGIVYDNRFLPPPGDPYSSYATFCRPLTGICFSNTQGQDSTDGSLRADYSITDDIHLKAIYGYSDYGGYLHQAGDVSPLGYVQGQVFFRIMEQTGEIRLTGSSFDHKLDWVAGLFDLEARDHLSGAIDFVTENFTEDDHYRNQSRSGFTHGEYHITDKLQFSRPVGAIRGTRARPTSTMLGCCRGSSLYDQRIPLRLADLAELQVHRYPDGLRDDSQRFEAARHHDDRQFNLSAAGHSPRGAGVVRRRYQERVPGASAARQSHGVLQRLQQAQRHADSIPVSRPGAAAVTGAGCLGLPAGGAINWYTTVSRPATIRGFEFETTAEPIERLIFNFSGGYNHFVDGVTTKGLPGYIAPGNLPMPEWNMTGGASYGVRFLQGMFTPRVDWVYQSESTFDPESALIPPRPLYTLGGRSTFNAQATFAPDNGKWSFMFNVSNLTNKYYLYELFTGSTVALAGVAAPPREFRFTARREFFSTRIIVATEGEIP